MSEISHANNYVKKNHKSDTGLTTNTFSYFLIFLFLSSHAHFLERKSSSLEITCLNHLTSFKVS